MSASLASKTIALFAIVATLAAGEKPNVSSFEEYVQVFRKSYGGSEEYATRKAIFESKAAAVVAHNEAADRGEVTWYEAVNSLSDRTELELAAIRGYDRALGYNRVNEHSVRLAVPGHVVSSWVFFYFFLLCRIRLRALET